MISQAEKGGKYSVLEEEFQRSAFKENVGEPVKFRIVSEKEAVEMLTEAADGLFESTRPINNEQYGFLRIFLEEYPYELNECACKDAAIRLLLDTRDMKYATLLRFPDIIALVDTLNYWEYWKMDIRKLNLKNRDRKLIARILDVKFKAGISYSEIRECHEKKALWSGLLHHIHYKNEEAADFLDQMRGKENHSVYSSFEKEMAEGNIRKAVDILRKAKERA